jgi:hypothetical protein
MADPRWRRDRNTIVFGIPDINTDTEFAAVWEAIDAVPIADRPRTRGVDPPQLFSLNGLTTAPKMHVYSYNYEPTDMDFGTFIVDENDVLGWGAGSIIALCSKTDSEPFKTSNAETWVVSYHPSTGAVKRGDYLPLSVFRPGTIGAQMFICDGVLVWGDPLRTELRRGSDGTNAASSGSFEAIASLTKLVVGADEYLITSKGLVYDPSADAWLTPISGPTGAFGAGDSVIAADGYLWCEQGSALYKAAASLTPSWTVSANAPRPLNGTVLHSRAGLPAAVDPANGDLYYTYNTGTSPAVHRSMAKISYATDTETLYTDIFSVDGDIVNGEPFYSGALLYPMQMYARSGYVYFVGAVDSRSTSRSFPQTDDSTIPPAARAAAVWRMSPSDTTAVRIDVSNTGAFPSLPPSWPPASPPVFEDSNNTDLDHYSVMTYGNVYPMGSRAITWLGAKLYGTEYVNTDTSEEWTTDVNVESWFRERRA